MAGGTPEKDPKKLARNCEAFQVGCKKMYESGPNKGDMWLFRCLGR